MDLIYIVGGATAASLQDPLVWLLIAAGFTAAMAVRPRAVYIAVLLFAFASRLFISWSNRQALGLGNVPWLPIIASTIVLVGGAIVVGRLIRAEAAPPKSPE